MNLGALAALGALGAGAWAFSRSTAPAASRVQLPQGVIALEQAGGQIPRGVRNNNPGNLRAFPSVKWQGQVGKDSAGFVIFDTPQNGMRALARDLLVSFGSGRTTVRQIVKRYAPPSENDTAAYIQSVATWMGIGPDTPLQLSSDPAQLARMVRAIVRQEQGGYNAFYTDAMSTTAVTEAMA